MPDGRPAAVPVQPVDEHRRRLIPYGSLRNGALRSIAWYTNQSWPAESVTTALCPVPTQRLPFGWITGVPPTRDASRADPSRSTNGPVGLCERPAKTLYPVVGPAQQFAAEPNR
jgi:hypothetical protein